MANIGYRLFNGSTDEFKANIGNLASANSAPETWIAALRVITVTASGAGEIVSCPGYDPLDFYVADMTGLATAKYQFYNGVVDSTDGPQFVNSGSGGVDHIIVMRRGAGVAVKWSIATWSGSAWSTFTHTTSSTSFANRTYPASGVMDFFNNVALNARCALVARCSAVLTDTEVATLTTDEAAWKALVSITNLWEFDKTPIVDVKGTSTSNTLTGTTVTANGFPLDAGGSSLTSVTASRATTWITTARVTASTRATTWATTARVTAATRATTWHARASVAAIRATTWNVTSALTQVTASRATTWNTRTAIVSSRASTWNTTASVAATRATTWITTARVTASTRTTTWHTRSAAAASRATTWNVLGNYYISDDFSGSSVDSAIWEIYNRPGDLANSEVNALTPANVRETSGSLFIDSKFEDVTSADTWPGSPDGTTPTVYHYTSGQVAQKAKAFQYGTIDVRAKIAGATGTWPCIWMLGREWQASQPHTANTPVHDWPNGGWWEIDIAEFMGGHRTLQNCALHFLTANRGGSGEKAIPYDATSRFMVYRLIWEPTSLVWQIDPEDGSGFQTLLTITGVAGTDIPNTAGYLIIHTAVGGTGGTPSSGTFPVSTEVDYARVALSANSPVQVSASRSTTWNVGATVPVTATRSTTWTARASVASSRATSWGAQSSITASRATSWNTRAAVSANRDTTWNTRAAVSANRDTTWNAQLAVSASGATSWNAQLAVSSSRTTTWTTRAQISSTRATSWNVAGTLASVTASRATTWGALASVVVSRVTTWGTSASVTSARSTTWSASSSVTSSRGATWNTNGPVSSGRATTWNVAGALAQVSASRATSWNVGASVAASRATSWVTLAGVAPKTVSTTWNTAAQVVKTTFTSWNVASFGGLTSVTKSAGTTWNTAAGIAANRSTNWNTMAPVAPAQRNTTWATLTSVSKTAGTTWNSRQSLLTMRATSWNTRRTVTAAKVATWSTRASATGGLMPTLTGVRTLARVDLERTLDKIDETRTIMEVS